MKSLRARLMLAYTGLIVLGFTILAVLAGRQISQGAIEDFERSLESQAVLLARGLKDTIEHYEGEQTDSATITASVSRFIGEPNRRLTLIDANGRVWLDTSGNIPTDNQTEYPEVAAAFDIRTAYDVRQDETGVNTIYAAAPIMEDDYVIGVVRLAAPAAEADATVLQRWLALLGGVATLTLVALAASLWLSASLTRPLERLRNSALRLAGGDLSHRLPQDRRDEIGQLATTFNHMADQVQRMISEQRAFASNASHELRTPLTTIRLRSEALREGHLDEATARQYVAEIDDEVTRLSGLVSDLILLSRFDAGRAEPGQERVDLARLAHNLARRVTPQAAARQVQLTLDAPSSLPPVKASLNHARMVFQNLLSNAVKYTPPGGQVVWRLWVDGDKLCSEIRDTGQGIEPEDLGRVFDRFYRADKARTRQVTGVGLGLSLTHSIVSAYNGRIMIDSPGLGQGTVATVWWPLALIDEFRMSNCSLP